MMHRPRILVIDDDPLFRSLIVSVLRKDYVVAVAADGQEGYFKALEHVPDLVIVDIQMPGWDGLRTLKEFRSQRELAPLPVVMLTSDASKETVLAAVQSGANDYVIKVGFSKEDFLSKLNRLLNKQQRPLSAPAPVQTPSPLESASKSVVAQTASRPTITESNNDEIDSRKLAEVLDDWE